MCVAFERGNCHLREMVWVFHLRGMGWVERADNGGEGVAPGMGVGGKGYSEYFEQCDIFET